MDCSASTCTRSISRLSATSETVFCVSRTLRVLLKSVRRLSLKPLHIFINLYRAIRVTFHRLVRHIVSSISSYNMAKVNTTFQTADYLVCASTLLVACGIGVFHACTGGRQRTSAEFLLADRNMSPFPVAVSLVASFISAITFLGTPAENYTQGCMYWLYAISYIFVGLWTSRCFIPIFYRLHVTSAFEYLELRFNKVLRICGMLTFFLQMIIYMGIVIYAPALALSAVTGLHLWGSVVAIGLVCTFYTTIGGMKAVLWTDVFQVTIMISGFLALIIAGSMRMGGIGKVWEVAEAGGRIDFFNFDPDPTVRHTFWSVVIGGTFTWSAVYCVNQAQVQRYLTCGREPVAQFALFLAVVGMVIVVSLACLAGLVMYANYAGCDPFTLGYVDSSDQLVPYFLMDLFHESPGLPGLLVSAVFSAALSTVSSGLNSLAAVTGEDIVKTISPDIEEEKYTKITKALAAGYGILCIGMAFVASLLGDVLQAALSIFGMIGGPLLGLFSLGIFFPWANSKGALTGLICGLVFSFWIGIGAQFYPPPNPNKPLLSIDNCPNVTEASLNATFYMTTELPYTMAKEPERPHVAQLYAVSYAWYSAIAWLTVIGTGLIASFATGYTEPSEVDPRLLCPVVDAMYCCLPEKWKGPLRCGAKKYEPGDDQYRDYKMEPIRTVATDLDLAV
ncbi:sodium-coupled monocarboxylate transporter 1-like isoform X2 [Patiria miniata]|uniref:Sodium-coupled monocarboxylate transporter 1 n=1 Tax=Patiria miniata TaxID=46514 RepID=A0A914A1Y6_PATMI|nr:sodium-coupled monocarboxylate transporter 1-like isoform X2 [Patiria miniata]XP_038057842.1 sodium-coupled monocarboxylate transporter 1-like isoform X2 [Patiria miniata]